MSFYQLLFGILVTIQVQTMIIAALRWSSVSQHKWICLSTLMILTINDIVETSVWLESNAASSGTSGKYSRFTRYLDLLNFAILMTATTLVAQNTLLSSVDTASLADDSYLWLCWILLAGYWAVVMVWSRVTGWYAMNEIKKRRIAISGMIIVLCAASGTMYRVQSDYTKWIALLGAMYIAGYVWVPWLYRWVMSPSDDSSTPVA